MKNLTLSDEATDDIHGVTLEERAMLVLLTLGRTPAEIRMAYRKQCRRHHPDTPTGDTRRFQLVGEAYALLTEGRLPKTPLLADDTLVTEVTGRTVEPLLDKQKEWEEYEHWRRDHFYGVGVV